MKPLQLTAFALLLATSALATSQTIKNYIDNKWPDNRYSVHGDGTVTDTVTGLMWKQCPQGQDETTCAGTASLLNWQQALQAAVNENFAKHTDWRLPNRNELQSLTAMNRLSPAINVSIFPNTPSADFWSSSPYSLDESINLYSWAVDFNYGGDSSRSQGGTSRLRLVRGGQ